MFYLSQNNLSYFVKQANETFYAHEFYKTVLALAGMVTEFPPLFQLYNFD